jgi:hypothetical protein
MTTSLVHACDVYFVPPDALQRATLLRKAGIQQACRKP